MEFSAEQLQESKPGISIAEFSLVYEVKLSIGIFESDREVVENHFNILAKKISANLTSELGAEFYLGNIEYSKGSVKVNGKILAAWLFITPIIQDYVVNQLPPLNPFDVPEISLSGDSKEKYDKICDSVETVTIQTIEEYEKHTDLKSKKTTITTREIEKLCQEWISGQKS